MRGHFLRAASYDPDAQRFFTARAVSAGDPVPNPYKKAINQYILSLKSAGLWDSIIQLAVFAGATTISGALYTIKGNNLTAVGLSSADVNPKTGVKGDGVSKYFQSNYSGSPSGTGQDNFHMYAHLTEANTATANNARTLFGNGGGAGAGRRVMVHDAFNSTTPHRLNGTATASASGINPGDHGMSRGSSANYTSLVVGTSTTHTDTSVAASGGPYYILARGPDSGSTPEAGSFSDARILIWALGAATTLTNYQAPRATLITALNAI